MDPTREFYLNINILAEVKWSYPNRPIINYNCLTESRTPLILIGPAPITYYKPSPRPHRLPTETIPIRATAERH